MAIPFLLGPGEQVIKESPAYFKVGDSRESDCGGLFLTSERLVLVRRSVFKKEIIATVPLEALVSVELEATLVIFMKSWGFKIQFQSPQGSLIGIRLYKEQSARSKAKEEWANDWVDSIQEVIETKETSKAELDPTQGGNIRPSSNLDELEKLATLRDKGIVTEEEFETKKKQLLDL